MSSTDKPFGVPGTASSDEPMQSTGRTDEEEARGGARGQPL